MITFDARLGDSPLVVSIPHSGTLIPDELRARLTPVARTLPDTDWHIPRLYDFLGEMGATVIQARYSRYVVDLNRDPSGVSLYPGQTTTTLVPVSTFRGESIYQEGSEPNAKEVSARRTLWFDPYHSALAELLTDIQTRFGFALLWDAHSIVSNLPRLFEGTLPALNLGTNQGRSAAAKVTTAAASAMQSSDFSCVVDGRFKGGWITRHYGRPDSHIHALQMEIAQSAYMQEDSPLGFDPVFADVLRPVLQEMISASLDAAASLY